MINLHIFSTCHNFAMKYYFKDVITNNNINFVAWHVK